MKLTYLKGIKAGESLQFEPPGIFVGRQEDNDLELLEDGVSQYHAKILYDKGQWTLFDLNSSNGTKINGDFINRPTELESKDVIYFAKEAFRFEFDEKKTESALAMASNESKDDFIRIRSPEESKPTPKPDMKATNKFPKVEKNLSEPPAPTKKEGADAATMRRLVNEAIREKKKRLRRIMLIVAVVVNLIILATFIGIKYHQEILDMLRSSG
jgi:predicted component of type VI protein secretion system